MKALYYNCFAGISGDMNLAALVDMGVPLKYLEEQIKKLNLNGWSLQIDKTQKNGISGTLLSVICPEIDEHCHCNDNEHNHEHNHEHHHEHCHCEHRQDTEHNEHSHEHCEHHNHSHFHRSYADIKEIINKSSLSQSVKEMALKIFNELAFVEAKVHSKSIDEVCFHEVGAVDSIIDIVGCAICIDFLKVEKIYASPVELGGGIVKCAHGTLPVPAPATQLLSAKFASKLNGANHECTTPTGAAIIAALSNASCPTINGKLIASGVGIGKRDCKELTNILNVSLYELDDNFSDAEFINTESIILLSANIDDMTAEDLSFLCDRLFECNALDVWQESILMKKGRLAQKVCVICKNEDKEKLLQCFFLNSTTLGVRQEKLDRYYLKRNSLKKDTKFGCVSIKERQLDGEKDFKIEFEDLAKIAIDKNISIMKADKEIRDELEGRKS